MKKIIIIIVIAFCFAMFGQGIKQQINEKRVEIRGYMEDIDDMIEFHESGATKTLILIDGTTFTVAAASSASQRAQLRTKIKAFADSVSVLALELKNLVP